MRLSALAMSPSIANRKSRFSPPAMSSNHSVNRCKPDKFTIATATALNP
ncbi:Uncharacterised protein [Vibrio cholerae]|nr:Uncharacterised protein [Vibrio cholerae]CSI88347.1 Uncharacterised protein [Vibrio cholerae]